MHCCVCLDPRDLNSESVENIRTSRVLSYKTLSLISEAETIDYLWFSSYSHSWLGRFNHTHKHKFHLIITLQSCDISQLIIFIKLYRYCASFEPSISALEWDEQKEVHCHICPDPRDSCCEFRENFRKSKFLPEKKTQRRKKITFFNLLCIYRGC